MHALHLTALISALPLLNALPSPSPPISSWPGRSVPANYPQASNWPQPNYIPAGPYCPPQPASPYVQAAIFNDFINKLYVQKNATDAYLTYVSPDYINHSPYAPQGRAAAIAFLSFLIPSVNRTILHQIYQGDTGAVHLKVLSQTPIALVDLFRLNGTCVVEHWDVNQPLPANATNPIALF